jgi:iron complex transport system substrate-binding protein
MLHVGRGVFRLLIAVTAAAALVGGCAGAAPENGSSSSGMTVTDVLGRTITIGSGTPRILLDGARLLYTTALLDPDDPVANVVGWPDDLKENDPDTYDAYLQRFPRIADIPVTGHLYDGSFSAEQAIGLAPDVFVVSAANFDAAKDAGTIDRLEQAGIPTVVVDYFVDPLKNSVPSVELMGRLMNRTAQADRFAARYRSVVDDVASRLAAAHEPPTDTFLWRAPGYFDCCSSFAHANLATLVTAAGGHNLADDLLPATQGTLSPEAVLTRDPAVVLATGADWAPGTPAQPGSFVPLGYREQPAQAAAQFRSVVERQAGFPQLQAVRDGRSYVVWHHFYDSPYNYLALHWFAAWLHPAVFPDVDPDAEIAQLHRDFLPVPATGAFWSGLS